MKFIIDLIEFQTSISFNLYIFFIYFINIYYFIEKNIVLSKQLNNKSKKNTILLLIYVFKIFFK